MSSVDFGPLRFFLSSPDNKVRSFNFGHGIVALWQNHIAENLRSTIAEDTEITGDGPIVFLELMEGSA